jgi:hypothetical protein
MPTLETAGFYTPTSSEESDASTKLREDCIWLRLKAQPEATGSQTKDSYIFTNPEIHNFSETSIVTDSMIPETRQMRQNNRFRKHLSTPFPEIS